MGSVAIKTFSDLLNTDNQLNQLIHLFLTFLALFNIQDYFWYDSKLMKKNAVCLSQCLLERYDLFKLL